MRLLATNLCTVSLLTVVACAAQSNLPAPSARTERAAPIIATAPEPLLFEEGSSLEAAVIAPRSSEGEGVAWEQEWIYAHYGRFRKKSAALASREGRRYDVITIELADHSDRVLYFDITDFFGK